MPPAPHARAAPRSGPPRFLVIGGVAAGAVLLLLSLLLRGSPPQILSVQFPQQIVAGAGYASGIVHFRAPKSDIAMARFDVLQATSFTPFSFPVAGTGRREGGIAFSVQSPIPQRVTLRAVLVDRNGRASNPVPFTFDVQPAPAAVPRRRDGRGVEFQAPNGFRFRVPR